MRNAENVGPKIEECLPFIIKTVIEEIIKLRTWNGFVGIVIA